MVSSLSIIITFHVVFSLTNFKVFVYLFRNKRLPNLVHLIKWGIMQSISLGTIISAHISLIDVQCSFEAKSCLCRSLHPFFLASFFIFCYHLHPANSFLFSSSHSGAFVDRVQLSDDNGTSAERKPQRDRGRPLHSSRLSAQVEGLYTVCTVLHEIKMLYMIYSTNNFIMETQHKKNNPILWDAKSK